MKEFGIFGKSMNKGMHFLGINNLLNQIDGKWNQEVIKMVVLEE